MPSAFAQSHIDAMSQRLQVYFEQIKRDPKRLHQFLLTMPKGGELHYHFSGSVYPEVMLSYAQKNQYCLDKKTFILEHKKEKCSGLPSTLLKQKHPWYKKIIQAWSMEGFRQGVESGHDHFFSTFAKFNPLFVDHRGGFLAWVMKRAAKQHERYVELMLMPQHKPSGKIVEAPLHLKDLSKRYEQLIHSRAFQASVNQALTEIKQIKSEARHELACDKHPDKAECQLLVKFQYHALRAAPLQAVFAQALQGFLMAQRSHEVVGVNLVQPEDAPLALHDYQKQMAIFGFLHHLYPEVHIALHAGELTPEKAQSHIHDAIFEGKAERIGHGVDVALEQNHAALLHYMAEHDLPVEINLSSNAAILNIKGQAHPLKLYLKYHVPVVLSTDDEGILRTSLTQEYQKAVEEQGLDYETLKQFSRNTLTYAFLPGASLWHQGGEQAKRVKACVDLNSQACLAYVAHSPKAKLQRRLELDFIAFEKRVI